MQKKQNKPNQKQTKLEERLKRALADYQNLEKRFAKESEKIIRFANSTLLLKLLELKDNLERASQNIQDEGINIVLNQLKEILTDEGVQEIKAKNQKFNPELMEADEAVKGKKDMVTEVVQKGYKLHDRILRPAKVKVGSGNNKDKKHKKD